MLSGESTTTDGETDRREFGRGSAGVPKSATWIDAPGRCAHGCVYVAGALRLFGGIASRAPASVHESVNVYLSATAAERARDRGARVEHRLYNFGTGALSAVSDTSLVCFDLDSRKSTPWPTHVRALLDTKLVAGTSPINA